MASGPINQVTNNSGTSSGAYYCKMPDGTMIQGRHVSISGNQSTAITFPIAFVGIPSVAISTGAGGTRAPVYIEDLSTTGFNAFRTDSPYSSMWCNWIAIGRWK